MVFGNMGDDSGTGVCFTRDPGTGEKVFYGEFLMNAQGEDVVAGIRTRSPSTKLAKDIPCRSARELLEIKDKLEKHYKDMQDIEFTIERRHALHAADPHGKRTGRRRVKIAVDMVAKA
jgi:pyruvate,orthophosphate dikinase